MTCSEVFVYTYMVILINPVPFNIYLLNYLKLFYLRECPVTEWWRKGVWECCLPPCVCLIHFTSLMALAECSQSAFICQCHYLGSVFWVTLLILQREWSWNFTEPSLLKIDQDQLASQHWLTRLEFCCVLLRPTHSIVTLTNMTTV